MVKDNNNINNKICKELDLGCVKYIKSDVVEVIAASKG